MVTAKVACMIAAEKAIARGDIKTHLRMLKLAAICPK